MINQVFGKYGNDARDTLYDECAATGAGHTFGPYGMKGESQCRYCGVADKRAIDNAAIALSQKFAKTLAQHNDGDVSAEELQAKIRELFDGPAKPPRFKPLALEIALCYPNLPKGIW